MNYFLGYIFPDGKYVDAPEYAIKYKHSKIHDRIIVKNNSGRTSPYTFFDGFDGDTDKMIDEQYYVISDDGYFFSYMPDDKRYMEDRVIYRIREIDYFDDPKLKEKFGVKFYISEDLAVPSEGYNHGIVFIITDRYDDVAVIDFPTGTVYGNYKSLHPYNVVGDSLFIRISDDNVVVIESSDEGVESVTEYANVEVVDSSNGGVALLGGSEGTIWGKYMGQYTKFDANNITIHEDGNEIYMIFMEDGDFRNSYRFRPSNGVIDEVDDDK